MKEKKTNTVTIRISDATKENLKTLAQLHGITMSELINKLIQAL